MPDFAVTTAFKATDNLSPAFGRMGAGVDALGGKINSLKSAFTGLLPAIGAASAGFFAKSSVDAAREMERLETAFSTVFKGDAVDQMKFIREETQRLGIDFQRSAGAYKGIAAAAMGTAINNKQVQETFLGVAEASSALQLTGEQTEGALLAISQIISKGKVSMEELRGQLGERIPGAMQIAARAMGVTTAEMEQLVQRGISAEVFIPKFAAQMRKEFGPAAMDAAKSFNAAAQRFDNLIFTMKVNVGKTLMPMLSEAMEKMVPMITQFSDWVRENKETIASVVSTVVPLLFKLGAAFTAYKIIMIGVHSWSKIVFAGQIIQNIGRFIVLTGFLVAKTLSWAAAQAHLNIIMSANPIGIIVMAIAAFIGFVTIAIKNWDDFGAAMVVILGPVGMLVAMFKGLYDNWNLISAAFQDGGILSGIKMIGAVVLSSLLYPIQQLLEIISSIPVIGQYAAAGAASIKGFREGLVPPNQAKGFREGLVPPNQAQAASGQVRLQGEININGAPAGTTIKSSTTGAGQIDINDTGPQYS